MQRYKIWICFYQGLYNDHLILFKILNLSILKQTGNKMYTFL